MIKLPISSPTKRYPCLFISDQVIYLAEINAKGDKFSVFRESAVPDGLLANGDVVNPEQYSAFLKQLIQQAKLKEKHIIVGLPELKATTQSIKVANTSSEETTDMVNDQAKHILPFPISDAYIDWRREKNSAEEKSIITLSAIPKAVIDRHVNALLQAGLTPVAFETSALTLTRMLPDQSGLFLLIDYSGSHVVVVISKNKSVEVSSVIQGENTVIDKISKLVQYYIQNDESSSQRIEGIYLAGKNITQGFLTDIEKTFQVKPVVLSANISNIAKERQAELALLGSLSRKNPALPQSDETINLLPESYVDVLAKERRSLTESYGKYGIMGVLMLIVGLTVVTLVLLRQKTTTIAEEVVALTEQQGNAVIFDTALMNLVATSSAESEKFIQLINTVFEKRPAGVILSGVSYEQETGEILVVGVATDRGSLLKYRENLNAVDFIKEVELPLSSFEQEVNVDFRLRIIL